MTPIEKAIEAFGSQKKLANALGVSPQFINQIKRRGGELTTDKVTPEQWVKVTGLSVTELFPEFAKLM
ncbi:helix-turn-helix domain-containing protein [Aggregatibacter actinomycetemcomitans]|uniref:transcriptional regulator n=1 Tax=Aggregatibacter actinomycetemcomitans TaxID=714 RepID=UPI00197BF460|nr:YdaS family helix-turn-helix protein [Aggregatibacter actinomycetemcomitans]MBN6069491.1 helix-turn-helix domain-containing protein [Aggregatibacter actinomycetemcomitans]MBN6087071.1 helix-turn-helix domain-containing protein [Aggregatibacter actinomycetemcomitans]